MAQEKGFYRDAGLDVDIREMQTGTHAVDELANGKVDYALGDTGVLLARANGIPIKILAAIFQHSPLALIVRKEATITKITDLRGKRIMMTPGLNADILAALGAVGISSSDFVRQEISYDINDLVNGNTDAFSSYITDQPHQLDLRHIPYRIFRPRDYGIDFYGDILVTSEKEIKKHPQRARAFIDASMQGWQYALAHIDETIDLILQKYNTQNLHRDQLKFEALKTKEMILGDIVQIGYMSELRWQHIADIYTSQGLLPAGFSVSQALYQPDVELLDVLKENSLKITFAFLIVLLFFFALNTMYLRRAVKQRTSELENKEKELQHLNRELELLSLLDGLTGIGNRRMFDQVLDREWFRAQRDKHPVSVILIDVDFFKPYNDYYGHQQGDDCLTRVAHILNGITHRSSDLCARYGGEEFVILLPDADSTNAHRLAEDCRISVADAAIPHIHSKVSKVVTISIGVSTVIPTVECDPSSLIKAADKLLYKAKKNGRNRVESEHQP
ncbi:MAG: hypothetical protein AUJ58_05185 [Zetaproteobacteria bacterium CG1_02_55_237]|nr:MAG: hypothetical protein AUJ58_05185 [Zetaproteobacteria bacterium CG1_02_55_237]